MTEQSKANAKASARRASRKASRATKAVKQELSLEDFKGVSPILVGFLRGCLHAAVMGVLAYITSLVSDGAGPIGVVATLGLAVTRSLEGILDKMLLGAPPQARLLGGKDASS